MDIAVPTLEDIAAILALAPPDQPWKLEGPCRHRIRAILILTRWTRSWHRADLEARRLVARGRFKNGVRMPAGWDADTDLSSWVGTNECWVCGRWFIPNMHNQIYCSKPCKMRAGHIEKTRPVLTKCGRCGDAIEDPKPGKKYCSRRCAWGADNARRWQRKKLVEPAFADCIRCGQEFERTRSDKVYCGHTCLQAASDERRGRRKANGANGHARPNGNGHAADPRGHDRDHEDTAPARPGLSGIALDDAARMPS